MTRWTPARRRRVADPAVHRDRLTRPAGRQRRLLLASTVLLASGLLAEPVGAASQAPADAQLAQASQQFDIAAQPLGAALDDFRAATGWTVDYPADFPADAESPGVSGSYTPEAALSQLLAGSNVTYAATGDGSVELLTVAAQPNGETLDPVVVSATRTKTPVSQLSRSVTVVGQEEINKQKRIDRNLGDILSKTVPGFSPSTEALTNYGQTLRGRKFLTMVDGVPQTMTLRDGQRTLNSIDADAIERVEVVRGGTAAYGFGATGGLVNVITRRPEDGALNGHSEAGLKMSTEHPDESLEWHTNHRVSGRSGKVDYLLSGSFVQRNSLFDADGDRIPAYGFGAQGGLADTDEYNVLGKLGYEFDGGDQRFELSMNHYDIEQDTDWAGIGVGDASAGQKTPAVRGDQGSENMYTESTVASLSYNNKDVAGSDVTSKVYYGDMNTRFAKWPGYDQSEYQSDKAGGRLTVDTPVDVQQLPFNLIWGADYLHDETISTSPDGSVSAPDLEQDAVAGFVEAEIPVSSWGLLRGGVRHEYISLDVADTSTSRGGTLSFGETLFNASAVTYLTDEVEVFGGYSQGFSVDDMGRVIEENPGVDLASLESEAKKVDNYELGVRGNFGVWDASVTGFYSQSDKGTAYDDSSTLRLTKQPEQIWGVELDGNVRPIERVRLGSTFTWMEGEVDRDDDGSYEEELPSTRVPPIKITSYVEYDPTDWASVRFQGLYSGHRDPDTTLYGSGEVDPYMIFDLFASFDTGYGIVELGIENLFNEDYFPVLHQAAANDNYYNKGPGRTASITYSVKW